MKCLDSAQLSLLASTVDHILPISLTVKGLGDCGAVGHSHPGAVGPASEVRWMDERMFCHEETVATI